MANEVKSPMVNTISVKVITTFMKIHIFLIALFYFKNWNNSKDFESGWKILLGYVWRGMAFGRL